MKLYSFTGSCGLAAHVVLGWIGQPFEAKMLQKEETKTPEFLKLNPMGKVPVLEDGDLVLSENAAVLTYLAGKYPQSRLHGDGTPASQARVDHWLGFINSEIHPAYRPLFGATAYLGDEAMIEKTRANARQQLRKVFGIADKQLSGNEYIAGDRSIADAYLFVTLMWAGFTQVDLSGFDNLKAFEQRMRADPAVQAALKGQGLAK